MRAVAHLDPWETIDHASAGRPDVPSGTAHTEVAGSRVHSVRLPSLAVGTGIGFGGTGERLVMRHDTGETPDPDVGGTLPPIRRVAETPGVRRGPGSLLFTQPGPRRRFEREVTVSWVGPERRR